MTLPPETPPRPVARPVRVLAILTLVAAVPLLAVGGLVTSMRAGMSDAQWPTEPWYLAVNGDVWANEPKPGFLIEHSHRALGFLVGILATALAYVAWWGEPNRGSRRFGLVSLSFLLLSYGWFHGAVRAGQTAGLKELTVAMWGNGLACVVGLVMVLWMSGITLTTRGGWVRALAAVSLVCVMVQGLLGGFRVYLNELVGTNLAAVHGVFGQVTFAVLTAVAVLAAPRKLGDPLPAAERSSLLKLAAVLVAVLLVQLVWAVWVRHVGTALAQRLHMLTAFVATGVAVWLAVRILTSETAKPRIGRQGWHLVGVLAVQLLLGVEAYMGKFAGTAPNANLPPDARPVSVSQAAIRTGHQLIGAGLLATAVGLAVRVGRRPVEVVVEERVEELEPLVAVGVV